VPTYQYSCTDCGHSFETVQSFSDDSLTDCPVCGGRLRKVYNAVGVVFKGSGFYRTDSRAQQDAQKDAQKKAKTSETASTGASSTKGSGESTPATKSDSSSSDSGSSKPSPAA
jgi:putative FmdB family regulatory protein